MSNILIFFSFVDKAEPIDQYGFFFFQIISAYVTLLKIKIKNIEKHRKRGDEEEEQSYLFVSSLIFFVGSFGFGFSFDVLSSFLCLAYT